jgi:hypothetical protein
VVDVVRPAGAAALKVDAPKEGVVTAALDVLETVAGASPELELVLVLLLPHPASAMAAIAATQARLRFFMCPPRLGFLVDRPRSMWAIRCVRRSMAQRMSR